MAMGATDAKDIAFLEGLDTNPGSYQHTQSNLTVSVAAMAISPTPSCTSSPASSIASSPSSPTYDDVVLPVVACASCKRSHIKCDHARPCLNCQKHPSKAATCRDAVPKPRGRPKGGSKIAAEAMMAKRQQQQGAFHPFSNNPLQYSQHVQQQPQQFHRQRAMSFPHILPPHQPVPYFLQQQQQQYHQQILQQQQRQIQQHQHQQHTMSHSQIPAIPQAEHQAFQSAQDRGVISTSGADLHAPHHHLTSSSPWPSQTTGLMSLPVSNDPLPLTTISTHTPESNVQHHPPMLTTPSIGVGIHTLDAQELQKLHLHRQQFRQHTQQQHQQHQQRQHPHQPNEVYRNPHEIGMTRSMSDHTGPGNQGRPFYLQRQQQAWPVQNNTLDLSIPSPMAMATPASSPASPGSFPASPSSMLPPPPPSKSSALPSCSPSMQQQYSPTKPRSMRSRSESTELASNRMAMLLMQQQHEMQFEMQLQHQRQQQQFQQQFQQQQQFQKEQEFACLSMQEQKLQQQQQQHQGRRHMSLSQPIPSHPMLLNELASPALSSSMDIVNLDRSAQLQQQQQQSHIQFHRRSSLQTGFSSPSLSTGFSPLTASNSSVSLSALNDEEMAGLDG
ncbi:hypothetical protein BG011_001218 [Mortierella polycephala]|uniref:Zn(2)-C6 fungal-type domain-containing protein n=1 Tax=Mortierella polycephala TaxID=41804 RepID=A0A9P6Q9M3_9FUNG|nr:hypothetical protein BG011_001218 [Mortierella polycephala]